MRTTRYIIPALSPAGRAMPPVLHFKDIGPSAFNERGFHQHQQDAAAQQGGARIRCPHCDWQPQRNSRWFCFSVGPPENLSGGCGHGWNTFDTRGKCPGCKHQWRFTTCLSCNQWSPHDDWYAQGNGGKKP